MEYLFVWRVKGKKKSITKNDKKLTSLQSSEFVAKTWDINCLSGIHDTWLDNSEPGNPSRMDKTPSWSCRGIIFALQVICKTKLSAHRIFLRELYNECPKRLLSSTDRGFIPESPLCYASFHIRKTIVFANNNKNVSQWQ